MPFAFTRDMRALIRSAHLCFAAEGRAALDTEFDVHIAAEGPLRLEPRRKAKTH